MIFFRRRLFLWLIKAYLKRWGKRIFIFFIVGLILFFSFLKYASNFIAKIPTSKHTSIGIQGDYKTDTLPRFILEEVSRGLTSINENGAVSRGLATSWKVLDGGKRYDFFLSQNTVFSDGTPLDSSQINYNFSDAQIERPSSDHIVFKLKDTYTPFLLSVSRPVFRNGFIGVGSHTVKKIELNGNFIKSITLANVNNSWQTKTYQFYPSQDAVKLAFLLGEIETAKGLSDTKYKDTSLETFPGVTLKKNTDYNKLVTMFYNTQDSTLSDEKVRNALNYAIPDSFSNGERNSIPFSPKLWVYTEGAIAEKKQDLTRSKELLSSSSASKSAQLLVTIKAFKKYKSTAQEIAKEWKKVNINATIEEVEVVPSSFQIFLGDFQLMKDPDQYALWHSSGPQNITRYQDLRIDKLLEDGRKTQDLAKRRKIYEDFQKYLLADSPASFLFFPYEYDLVRD